MVCCACCWGWGMLCWNDCSTSLNLTIFPHRWLNDDCWLSLQVFKVNVDEWCVAIHSTAAFIHSFCPITRERFIMCLFLYHVASVTHTLLVSPYFCSSVNCSYLLHILCKRASIFRLKRGDLVDFINLKLWLSVKALFLQTLHTMMHLFSWVNYMNMSAVAVNYLALGNWNFYTATVW